MIEPDYLPGRYLVWFRNVSQIEFDKIDKWCIQKWGRQGPGQSWEPTETGWSLISLDYAVELELTWVKPD